MRLARKIVVPIVVLLCLGFILFLINQISGLYILISGINLLAGQIVLVCSLLIFGALMLSPLIVFLRMPRPIVRPKEISELPIFHKHLLSRLRHNKILSAEDCIPKSVDDLEQSVGVLNKKANEMVVKTATIVFLTTAISQNGKLDAFTVLGAQMRMVWKIAHIYYHRPTLREIAYLYGNVGASAMLAYEIEDLDLSRQIEPVVTAVLRNSSSASVPMIGPATQILMDSLLEGSTNAFLTLRVGIMAMKMCGSLGVIDRSSLKKEVMKEAAVQLKAVTISASGMVIKNVLKAVKNAGIGTLKTSWKGLRDTGIKMKDGLVQGGRKMNPFGKKDKEANPID